MKFYIVIPAHNEENTLKLTLQSLVEQTLTPSKLVVVNDNSTDNTGDIISKFENTYEWITGVKTNASNEHLPGAKVINAFYEGYNTLDNCYDIICKFDGDIIFPKHYLEVVASIFNSDSKVGVAGGLPYIKKHDEWLFEKIASKDHVRGPIKAYRKACFNDISGLRHSIGWDSLDVLLAQYHGWGVKTDKTLKVKHLKPTGFRYQSKLKYKQGEALYKMRLGTTLSYLSALKSAINRKSLGYFLNTLKGYNLAKKHKIEFLVDEEQGEFIRKLRWRNIRKKVFQ